MSRPIRFIQPNCLYHITSRGNRKQDIVRDDADRRAFVQRLAHVVIERRWILHAWVLMSNHLHLVVTTPLANLSHGMRDLLGAYAKRFNRVHDLVGHVFQHRFDAKLVERETHLLELIRYVPLNPVRCGLVRSPGDWPWSSYRAYAGYEVVPEWVEVDWTLAQFHPADKQVAQHRFREFVAAPRDVEYDPHAELSGGWILGSAEFRSRVQAWIDSMSPSREHPRHQLCLTQLSPQTVIDTVKRELRLSEEDIRRRTHGPARKVIADLLRDECQLSFPAIGTLLGTTGWGAAKLRARSRELALRDREYGELLANLREWVCRPVVHGEKLRLQT